MERGALAVTAQALRQYRAEFVANAKAVVVGMTPNGFTLADPKCLRTATGSMLDLVGFDTSVPPVISDFVLIWPVTARSKDAKTPGRRLSPQPAV